MSMVLFFYAAVRSKLRKIDPKVIHLLLILDAGENHFGTWNHPLWVLDIVLESSLIPNNPRILICVLIVEAGSAPRVATIQSV